MKRHSRSGFTLVEAVIGLAIATVVVGAAIVSQHVTHRLNSSTSMLGILDDRALRGLDTISADLRWASAASVLVSTVDGFGVVDVQTPVNFVDGAPVWSSLITYRVEPSPRDSNSNGVADDWRLVRVQDGETRTLTDHVVPGGFSAELDLDHFRVRLALGLRSSPSTDLMTTDVRTSIQLRN